LDPLITYRGTVYPWQCDHVGHLNIMWYSNKFDEASWNLLAQFHLTPSYLRQSHRGMAALQQNVTYKRELFAGDIIEVRSRLLEVRDKVLRFAHELCNAESGEVAAICEFTAVHIDRKERKACNFTHEIRAAAEILAARQSGACMGADAEGNAGVKG
jgi:acyl-CoA thioester hydrolase